MGAGELGLCLWLLFSTAAARSFAVNGSVEPAGQSVVWLYGATSAFSSSTLSDPGGRFHFGDILPGSYTLIVPRRTASGERPSTSGRLRRTKREE